MLDAHFFDFLSRTFGKREQFSIVLKENNGEPSVMEWRILAELPRAEGVRAEPHTLEILINPSSRENLVMTSPYERASEGRPYRLWGRGRGASR